ncbi:MAG: Holliday junction branch migration protein RuvA [Lachnospiraceae bacterium]|nr:Holliday junction branch migration protein RuvA [Lachnospiraceae bacterium]MCI1726747.1 Holliday junction branch migration protein RuvA [Lachnospiraceae bacterium]
MISYIIGTISEIRDESLVLENNGIGYFISVPSSMLDGLTCGDEVRIHTYMAVREDAIALYGFRTKDDLGVFRLLLGVSGIGPKGALAVLSALSADDLRFAVLADDAATISKVPGIGKKTAQKLILELKDKMDLQDAFEKKAANTAAAGELPAGSPQSEAVLALASLGYPSAEALKAVRKVSAGDAADNVEELLKKALKEL